MQQAAKNFINLMRMYYPNEDENIWLVVVGVPERNARHRQQKQTHAVYFGVPRRRLGLTPQMRPHMRDPASNHERESILTAAKLAEPSLIQTSTPSTSSRATLGALSNTVCTMFRPKLL